MSKKKKRPVGNPMVHNVQEVFRTKLKIVKRVQCGNNSGDIVAKFDLSEEYLNRRIKAVQHTLSPIIKRYAKKYLGMDVVEEFMEAASCSIGLTYDGFEKSFHACKGAAIWMLDQIEESGAISQLCRLLSQSDNDIAIPDVYDAQFSNELITRMLCMLLKRYGEADRAIIPSSYFAKRPDTDIFHEILSLIPDEAKNTAAIHFKEKYWEWADLYYEGHYPIVQIYKEVQREQQQFERERDYVVRMKLQDKGIKCLIVWECTVKRMKLNQENCTRH